ncbi:MAG: hypothetical protein GPJ54_09390 [Candidatus Heimdallarchaeota archaeon]|nr:hypothetical protein [Candidatus Heimdallarchaeota archaeon]
METAVLTPDIFEISIDKLQPSQLFINQEKLKSIYENINEFGVESLDPVPVKRFGEFLVLTDGHTRVLAQFQIGKRTINACWEDLDMDWREYQICIDWCKEEEITSIKDLENRIVSNDDYQVLWLKRCRDMRNELK